MSQNDKSLKSRISILKEFSKLLNHNDPMKINSPHGCEYEGEALSILSRFTESALHSFDNEYEIFESAKIIVEQCFSFWFDELPQSYNFEQITFELLTIYLEFYNENTETNDINS